MKQSKTTLLVLAALVIGVLGGQHPAVRAQLDRLIKGAAIIAVVDKTAPDIDKFINRISGNKEHRGVETKVVPILSLGRGTYAGAAQVTGPPQSVELVKAVALVEGEAKILARVKARALIPVSNRNVAELNSLARVPGVGLSATVELKL